MVKHTSIRILLALTANQDLELEQMDVRTTFLHGNLEETIYVRQPEGFEVAGKESNMCLLKCHYMALSNHLDNGTNALTIL